MVLVLHNPALLYSLAEGGGSTYNDGNTSKKLS